MVKQQEQETHLWTYAWLAACSQMDLVVGIQGILPRDELTSQCQWSACSCPDQPQPLARRQTMTQPFWADEPSLRRAAEINCVWCSWGRSEGEARNRVRGRWVGKDTSFHHPLICSAACNLLFSCLWNLLVNVKISWVTVEVWVLFALCIAYKATKQRHNWLALMILCCPLHCDLSFECPWKNLPFIYQLCSCCGTLKSAKWATSKKEEFTFCIRFICTVCVISQMHCFIRESSWVEGLLFFSLKGLKRISRVFSFFLSPGLVYDQNMPSGPN